MKLRSVVAAPAARVRNLLLVLCMVVAMLAVVAPQSADACAAGEICYWGEDSFTGCMYYTPYDDNNLSEQWYNCSAKVDNGTNSFKNRGNYCSITMYDYTLYRGGHKWAQREGLGGWWQDANLGNNTWSGSHSGSSGTIMENDITSHDFCA